MSSIMDYNGYHAKVEYDGRDNIFVGTVRGLNDMLGFHGAYRAITIGRWDSSLLATLY